MTRDGISLKTMTFWRVSFCSIVCTAAMLAIPAHARLPDVDSANVTLHFEAESLSHSHKDGDAVRKWTATVGPDAVAELDTRAPTFTTNWAPTKLPGITFDGERDPLLADRLVIGEGGETGIQAQAMFAVLKMNATGSWEQHIFGKDNAKVFGVRRGELFVVDQPPGTPFRDTTKIHVVSWVRDSPIHVDGRAWSGHTVRDMTFSNLSLIGDEQRSPPGNPGPDMTFGELIAFGEKILSATDRATIENYLMKKYGVTASPDSDPGPEYAPGITLVDRQRNTTLLQGYDYSKYPAAITGFNGQDLQRIGTVTWHRAERVRVGPRGSYKAGMTQLPDGTLVLAACRSNNKRGPLQGFLIDVYASSDEGMTWAKVNKTRLYGKEPSLTALPNGSLVLTVQDFGPGSTKDKVVISRSGDGGVTWQTGHLPGRAYPRNIILEADGSLLMIRGGKGMDSPHLQLCRSQNGGETWDISEGVINWTYQPYSEVSSMRHQSGRLIAVLRTLLPGAAIKDAHGYGVGMVTHSIDDGKTWSKPQVITNNAEVHVYLTQLRDGRILATYTNYHLPFGTYAIVSSDGGHTWDRDHPIQLAVSALNQSGWPVTLQLADDSLITAYATTAYLHQTRKFATEVVRWKMP